MFVCLMTSTDVLQRHTTDADLKRHVISYLRDQTKSFDYTRAVLANLEQQVRDELRRLRGNTKLELILNTLVIPEEQSLKARL
jgi:geranylgeranyl diphosphate synthase type 3